MALSHKKLLKKKQQQKSKQKSKHKSQDRVASANSRLPVCAAWMNTTKESKKSGICAISFVRKTGNNDYLVVCYLVDLFCLGVKDAFLRQMDRTDYNELFEAEHSLQREEPGKLKKLLQAAIQFGRKNGFEPGGDYKKLLPYIANINTKDSEEPDVQFGKKGKVVYIANPDTESKAKIQQRLQTLRKTLGPDGFTFIAPVDIDDDDSNNDYDYETTKMFTGQNGTIIPASKMRQHSGPIMTTTGEGCMPMRLYYKVYDKTKVLHQLEKLKCAGVVDNTHFHISYHKESKKFGLATSYKKVPKQLFPIILAKGEFVSDTQLHVDVRSYERGLALIPFLDKHISRDVMKITEVATYNEIITDPKFTPEQLFSEKNGPLPRREDELHEFMDSIDKTDPALKRQTDGLAFLQNMLTKPLPLVEKAKIDYYHDGVSLLKTTLTMKQHIACEHVKGNADFSYKDIFSKIAPDIAKQLTPNIPIQRTLTHEKQSYSLGDSVMVNTSLIDDVVGDNIKGYQGRIIELYSAEDDDDSSEIVVEWDSHTLADFSEETLKRCNEKRLGYRCYTFTEDYFNCLTKVEERDTLDKVFATQEALEERYGI